MPTKCYVMDNGETRVEYNSGEMIHPSFKCTHNAGACSCTLLVARVLCAEAR